MSWRGIGAGMAGWWQCTVDRIGEKGLVLLTEEQQQPLSARWQAAMFHLRDAHFGVKADCYVDCDDVRPDALAIVTAGHISGTSHINRHPELSTTLDSS